SLPRQAALAAEHDAHLDAAVRPVTGPGALEGGALPAQLTSRARRVLERGQELLEQLRALAGGFAPPAGRPGASPEPLAVLSRETVALIDTALRTVGLLPSSTTAQLHLCQGLEVALEVAAARLRTLTAGTGRQRAEDDRIGQLAGLLQGLAAG